MAASEAKADRILSSLFSKSSKASSSRIKAVSATGAAASLGVLAVAALIILELQFGLPVALLLFLDPSLGFLA